MHGTNIKKLFDTVWTKDEQVIIFQTLYIYSCGSLLSVSTVNSTAELCSVDQVTEISMSLPLPMSAFRKQNKYIQEQFSIPIKFRRSLENMVALWGVMLVNPLSFVFFTCLFIAAWRRTGYSYSSL
jgi:hypothetical protein